MNDIKVMNRAADNIRVLAASMVEKAKSGHPGGAMGGADFINVLFSEYLVYDPKNPEWEGRALFSPRPDRQIHHGRTVYVPPVGKPDSRPSGS